jgi:dihydropteroate synthase
LVLINNLRIDNESPTRIMGILNVSPESFYKGSVKASRYDIKNTAIGMEASGASLIDVGGMSTAPYLSTYISIKKETNRVAEAVSIIKRCCTLPISVDTPRAEVAKVAINRGASLVNDVTGLKFDKGMANMISGYGIPVIVGAYSKDSISGTLSSTLKALRESLELAKKAGIAENKIIVDPSIGFFRREVTNNFSTRVTSLAWYARDLQIIRNLNKLQCLSKPVSIGVSNKSFIGELFKLKLGDRLVPALISELKCSFSGAKILRTHHVRETALALKACKLFGIGRRNYR